MLPIAWLQLRQILGEKKVFFIGLFLAFPILLSGAFTPEPGWDEAVSAGIFLFLIYPQTTCGLLALLYGSSILNAELDGKTITYLFTRPIPKWKIFVAKVLAIVGFLTGPTLASFLVSWVVIGSPGGLRFVLGFALAIAFSIAVCTSIFFLISVLFRKRPMVVGVIYGMIEFALSFIPALISTLTATYFLRSIVARVIDLNLPAEVARLVGAASLVTAVLTLTGITVGTLALGCWLVSMREQVVVEAV